MAQLVTAADRLTLAKTREQTIVAIGETTLALFGADRATLWLLEDSWRRAWSYGLSTRYLAGVLGRQQDLLRETGLSSGPRAQTATLDVDHAVETVAPLALFEDIMTLAPTSASRQLGEPEGIRAQAVWPLVYGGRLLGVIGYHYNVPHAWSVIEREIVPIFCRHAAAALETARFHDDGVRRLRQLEALREGDVALSASLDLEVTLSVLLDKISAHLGADAADVLLFNAATRTFNYATGRGFRTVALRETRLRAGEGYAGQAAYEQRQISVADLRVAPGGFTQARLIAEEDFVAYHAIPLVAKGVVKGVIELFYRRPADPDPQAHEFLEALARQAAIAIDASELLASLQRVNTDLAIAYDRTIEGWSRALDLRDRETEGHSRRVAALTERLARALGVVDAEFVHLRRGALLHDIGKMAIPDGILLKPGALTEAEWEVMRRHPEYAHNLLAPIEYLRPALDIPYGHHEKWDGTGYPRGLRGEAIPLAARIFAVVDVWDALTSDRPYGTAWSEADALTYIREQAGQHFDPNVVEAFLSLDLVGMAGSKYRYRSLPLSSTPMEGA
ncbi:MAG TPA: HD domain-containing phosphohydrolase [bacterium]|nr:HD domain-containing phosphohydrolase [bacterium]